MLIGARFRIGGVCGSSTRTIRDDGRTNRVAAGMSPTVDV